MNPLKVLLRSAGSVLPLGFLLRTSYNTPILPYHHVVSDEDLPHIHNLYAYKNRKQFLSDLDWLLVNFKPIHPTDLASYVYEEKPLPEKSFLLSFDDGFREIYDIVAPLLLRKGVPAIFFINPAFIDNRELFYRCKLSLVIDQMKQHPDLRRKLAISLGCQDTNPEAVRRALLGIQYPERHKADEIGKLAGIDFSGFLEKKQPFLTTGQLKHLTSQGFTLGGHSLDHPNYRYLTPAEQVEQTLASCDFVKTFQPELSKFFAFPHEDRTVAQDYFRLIKKKEDGMVFLGTQNGKLELYNHVLHRFNAESPGIHMSKQVKTILLYKAILRLLKTEKVSRNTG